MKKTLIVYYSFSNGNTQKLAEQLAGVLDADLARIDTIVSYPPYGGAGSAVVSQGQREVETGYCPEIQFLPYDVKDYDVVAIGTPTWWYTMAPAVLTFLKSQDWTGKTVIPFMTHGGWPGHVLKDIKKWCRGADFLEDMEIRFDSDGGSKMLTCRSEIDAWMNRVKNKVFRE